MEHLLQDITPLVSQYGLLIVFIGVMVEGTAMILISGVLCYLGMLSFSEALPVAILGAVIGDHFWFYMGSRYGTTILTRFPKLAKQSEKALALITKKANMIAASARFIYAGGIIFPLMLGVQHYPSKKYHLFDILGDSLWALVGLGLGYYLGNGVEKAFGKIEQVEHLLLLFFVIVMLVWAYKNKYKGK